MRVKRFTTFLVLVVFPVIGTARSATLTLKDCLLRVQQNSHILQAYQHRAEASRKNYQFEKARTLPQFSGELSREQRYLQPFRFRQQWALVHGDWALGDFLLKTARAADQDMLMAKAEKEQIRLQVVRRAALLYVNYLQKQASIDLLQRRVNLLKVHHDVARALWQAGTRTQLDVLQTESQLSQLAEQMAVLDMQQQNLLQELMRLTGWQQADSLRLQPIDAVAICARPLPEAGDELLQSNPLVRALDFRIKAQRIRTLNARAQQLPHVYVDGGFFADGDPSGDGNYWQVDAGITLPLFQWGTTKYQRQRSQALVQSLESRKKDVQRELKINIEQTLEKMRKLKRVLGLQQSRLQTVEKTFRFAEANYQAGLITNLDYLSAQQQLTATKIAIQETQLEYVMNLVEFYIMTNQVEKIEAM